MAIDAVIERIRQVEGGLRLELAPRVDRNGQDSIAGRRALTIRGERRFEPQVGMLIWGGANACEIVAGPEYDRKGTDLRERRTCPNCFLSLHWADITDTLSGVRREVRRCDACGAEAPL